MQLRTLIDFLERFLNDSEINRRALLSPMSALGHSWQSGHMALSAGLDERNAAPEPFLAAEMECLLRVKSRHLQCKRACPLCSQQRPQKRISAKGRVWRCKSECPLRAITLCGASTYVRFASERGQKQSRGYEGLSLLQAENVVDDVVGIRTGHYKIWHSTFVA